MNEKKQHKNLYVNHPHNRVTGTVMTVSTIQLTAMSANVINGLSICRVLAHETAL